MSNSLDQNRISKIAELTRQSFTIRQICRTLSVSKATVEKYQRAQGLKTIDCACGKPITHRGFCSIRYANAPARQEFMRQWHAKSLNEIIVAVDPLDDCSLMPK